MFRWYVILLQRRRESWVASADEREFARHPDACHVCLAARDAEEYSPKRATILKRVHDAVEARGSVDDRTLYRHYVLPRLRLVVPQSNHERESIWDGSYRHDAEE